MCGVDENLLTTLKILIGNSGMDKSSLFLRFTDDTFDPDFITTIVK